MPRTHARQEVGAQHKTQNEGTAPTPTPLVWERERGQASVAMNAFNRKREDHGGRAEAIVSKA
jgi:hypothetical protein